MASWVEFRITERGGLYAVEMYRDNQRYVAFVEGLTNKEAAEREARRLTAFWQKISSVQMLGPDFGTSAGRKFPGAGTQNREAKT